MKVETISLLALNLSEPKNHSFLKLNVIYLANLDNLVAYSWRNILLYANSSGMKKNCRFCQKATNVNTFLEF